MSLMVLKIVFSGGEPGDEAVIQTYATMREVNHNKEEEEKKKKAQEKERPREIQKEKRKHSKQASPPERLSATEITEATTTVRVNYLMLLRSK